MKIEQLPTDSLEIEPGFNVRSDDEVKANAKELAHQFSAFGGFDPSLPITYVQRGKQKLVRSGHTRLAAAKLLEIPEVCAVRVDDDRKKSLVSLVTSNSGNPLTRRQQGEIFARLRDGVVSATVDPEGKTDIVLDHAPVSEKEIAKLYDCSYEHVRQCLAIFEAPDEIRPMLDSDEVSENIYVTAMQWAGQEPKKAKRILQAALRVAKSEGKDKATKKHLDAIKHEFVELKAKGSKKKTKAEAPASGNGAQSDHEETPAEVTVPAGQNREATEIPALDIGGHNTPTRTSVIVQASKNEGLKPTLEAIIRACSEEYNWAATDSDVEGCVEKILEAL